MVPDERNARAEIDRLLSLAGWSVQDLKAADIHGSRGVALREFPLKSGHGHADYLLYVDGRAVGVIEAKSAGSTLTGVEFQSAKYAEGLPEELPAWQRPLPVRRTNPPAWKRDFPNGLDPEPRCPQRLRVSSARDAGRVDVRARRQLPTKFSASALAPLAPTFLSRVRSMPPLVTEWGDFKLWPAQIRAIRNLEASLAQNKPRALIQMATGSGKTFTAISFIYRLIKFGGARRVLFLVDRGNLGGQAEKEFHQYVSPDDNRKFTELYNVQRLHQQPARPAPRASASPRSSACTRCSKGRELPEEADEDPPSGVERLSKEPVPIDYNPAIPDRDLRHHRHRRVPPLASTTCGARCSSTSTPT